MQPRFDGQTPANVSRSPVRPASVGSAIVRWPSLLLAMALAWIAGLHDLHGQEADLETAEVTVRTSNENIRVLLEMIADQSGYNIVIPENVQRTVSVALDRVPLRQALDSILLLNGFRYQVQDRTVLVYAVESAQDVGDFAAFPLRTRVINLRHVPAQHVEETITQLLTARGKVMVVRSPRSQGWEIQGGLQDGGGTAQVAAKAQEVASYQLVVVDEERVLNQIDEIIAQIDRPLGQVYISVVIFEMNISEQEQIGFRWRLSADLSGSSLPWNFPFGGHDVGEYTSRIDPGDIFAPTEPGRAFPDVSGASNADGSSTGSNIPFLFGRIGLSGTDLLAELNRLGADFNLVSNPRIMVSDHQEGAILIGERFPILRSNITDQGTLTETFDRYEPIGILVRVVPHILENSEVELLIHPQVTNLGALVVGTTGLTTPRITTREVDSKVRVRSGESVVIAGLVTERTEDTVTAVPYLSDIPWLGALFRHRSTRTEKVDLVMVVTPYLDGKPIDHNPQDELRQAGVEPPPAIETKTKP
ncbi:MAG: secretin and TonB N-terminal domain-containing protein [Planctomycetota bacterium]